MPIDRTAFRNVHFFDASTGQPFGGCYQAGSLTEQNILWILENILLVSEAPWTIQCRRSGRIIASTNNTLSPGDYEVHSGSVFSFDVPQTLIVFDVPWTRIGSIRVSDEPWAARLMSHSISSRENSFPARIRQRDGKCVISGRINNAAQYGIWAAYEAAHVFPLEHESIWNGLLILHYVFDQYLFSVNPDDGYKIVSFLPDYFGIDGRILDPICRDPENLHRVSDEGLRWHFRQSVLDNMRGAGEPVFEHDFPPGTDMLDTWRQEPYGKERFEMAVATKLKTTSGNEPAAVS
ncbi:hypothetical protein BDFG_06950 [Blastomyces dermatitidis ATCC 26199]|nr:hypothetical protein BDFG_06950 [Blastomyces dermatitidis ATCC 26199]